MSSIYKYRIYCNTESTYAHTWSSSQPLVCPNNNAHSINSNTTTIVDTITRKDVTVKNDMNLSNRDGFNRYKIAQPFSIFSLNQCLGSKSIYMDTLLTGTATCTTNTTTSIKSLQVFKNSDRVVYQTREYFPSTPTNSKIIYLSGVFQVTSNAGTRSRIGVFDDHNDKTVDSKGNGTFFEYYNNILSVVERSSTSGSNQTDTDVSQSNWNIDPMNGTGPSGLTIDPTKILSMVIEYTAINGIVKTGFLISGNIYWAHVFDHSLLAVPYILYTCLPIRFEITNVSSGVNTIEMRVASISVQIDGNSYPGNAISNCAIKCAYNETGYQTISAAWNTIFSLRLSSTGNRRTICIDKLSIATDTKIIKWKLTYNSTLSGASWSNFTNHQDSLAQIDTSASASGGAVFKSGVVAQADTADYYFTNPFEVSINASITGISDTITLQAYNGGSGGLLGNTGGLYFSIDWLEVY